MFCGEFGAERMDDFDAVAFGCPSMGSEQLEEGDFEPMFTACEGKLAGKKIALFGSYGWGDGEWMRSWEDTCRSGTLWPIVRLWALRLCRGGVSCRRLRI